MRSSSSSSSVGSWHGLCPVLLNAAIRSRFPPGWPPSCSRSIPCAWNPLPGPPNGAMSSRASSTCRAIFIYLRACERGARGRGWYWLSVAAFVLALLSKSMVVNLPVVLLILDVYPLRRLGGAVGWWSAPARRVYVEKIPFVLLAAAASAIALWAQLSHDTMVSVVQLSALGRLAVSVYGLSFYLWKTVAPVNLSPLYE